MWIGIGVGAVVVVTALMAVLGKKSVRAEGVIDAPPSEVWAVLTHAEGYPEWNPVFVRVEGEHRESSTMRYQMAGPDGSVTAVEAKVVRVERERELNQAGGIPGILTFDHHWTLTPRDNSTHVVQHEYYRGIGVWFWDPSWFEDAYGRAIEGLSERVQRLRESDDSAQGRP